MTLTHRSIEFLQTPKGSFTKKTLQCLGVSWPPQRGWKRNLIRSKAYISDIEYIKAVGYSEARAAKRPSLTEQTLLTLD